MIFLFSLPGGSEWIFLILLGILFLMMPVLAIVYYSKYKDQKRQVQQLTQEKNDLMNRLLNNR